MKYFLLAILALNLSCSVNSAPAKKELMDIRNPLGKPTDETGEMGTTEINIDVGNSFSIFMWPELPKMPLEKISEEVTLMSREIDRLTKSYRETNARILREQNFWSLWRCSSSDKASDQTSPKTCEDLLITGGAPAACSCLAANDTLLRQQNQDNITTRMALGEKIMKMVEDDGDPSTPNWLLGGGDIPNRAGSVLKIRQPEGNQNFDVYLRFKHFGPEDMTYKTPAETPTKLVEKGFEIERDIYLCEPDSAANFCGFLEKISSKYDETITKLLLEEPKINIKSGLCDSKAITRVSKSLENPNAICIQVQKFKTIKVEGCDVGFDVYTKKNGTKVCIPADTDPKVGRILYTEYNAAKKTLSFALIEKSNGSSTGNVFYFLMERGAAPEGAPELVRFKGNFQKVGILGQNLGIGAAKFDGDWTKEN